MQLITGASGFIGNVLVRQLQEGGQALRALVRPGKNPFSLRGLDIEIVPGDVLDVDSLLHAMDGVDVVYHLAAKISFASGPDLEAERVNLQGTQNVITAMRRAGARKLVYTSSVYALSLPGRGVVDETLPFDASHARGSYDRSKAAASLEVKNASGLETVIVCPTAVVGPYDFQVSDVGRGILYNMRPGIKFYVDGAYDFVDVRDVAHGLIMVAEKGRSGETYILGGDRLSILKAAETIWELSGGWHKGLRLPDWVINQVAGLMPLLVENPLVTAYGLRAVRSNSNISHEKATRELDFHPRPAEQSIRDSVLWWQDKLKETWQIPDAFAKRIA